MGRRREKNKNKNNNQKTTTTYQQIPKACSSCLDVGVSFLYGKKKEQSR